MRCGKPKNSTTKALPYFNVNTETTLQMDASKKGLRACLIQNSKVVCYASEALTKTEQNYQNLERDALGTIWGMEKFHYFLYGKEFTLETDQKPFVSIYKKHMVDISPRVQRLIDHFHTCLSKLCTRREKTFQLQMHSVV